MEFTEGAPPTNEQPSYDDMTPEDRFIMEQLQQNKEFRVQARQLYHQARAGQIPVPGQQQPQPQPRQESALAAKQRELAELEGKRTELERNFLRSNRDATPEEANQWKTYDSQIKSLESELVRIQAQEALQRTEYIARQQEMQGFQQAVGQRFAQFAQPKINAFNVSGAEKQRLYNKFWELFTSHKFYPQLADLSAVDELLMLVFDSLVARHGAPKQHTGGVGRTGEQFNDAASPEPEGAKDRWAHLPDELAAQMRRKYGDGVSN